MAGKIYSKAFSFSIMAAVTVLIGTIVTVAYPLVRPEMHVKVEGLRPLGPLELAGRDVYQREGCVGCHTQTVRPLKSEVVRYKGQSAQEPAARYSLAGEFAYDHPFLWGSKRTGPDLAFEGWIKPSRDWHYAHYADPRSKAPRSNMPAYAFLAEEKLDPAAVVASMRALRRVGVPYTDADLAAAPAAVEGKTAMDALVAYTVSLGKAVDRAKRPGAVDLAEPNPLAGKSDAIVRGARAYQDGGCAACHGDGGEGAEGIPSLVDDRFLGVAPDMTDAAYAAIIRFGSDVKPALGRPGLADGGMPPNDLDEDDLWSIVAWLREQKAHEARETAEQEAGEHR
ncbi:MAG TPA: cbb3-type cytochrome c oxidase subunit II [Anaeromyxobacter sp.]|nr:cbb3-type cytochrome c oxidase subunit II [Anaeromyxobacter sp.]